MTLRSTVIRTFLVAFSLFLALLIAEVSLRLLNKPNQPTSGWRAKLSANELNQLGFRGHTIEYTHDDFVIVMLGDSFVEAEACSYEGMPERRLQSYLNASGKRVKVFSVAANGYGQDQELLALRDYFALFRADMVILWETPINDVWNNMFPSSFGTPKPTFWLENVQLHGPSEKVGQPLGENSKFRLIQLWSQRSAQSRDRVFEKYYPPAYQPLTEYKGEIKYDAEVWNHNNAFFSIRDIDNEKSPLAISLTPRSERMHYGLDLTRKLMQEIEQLTLSHSGQFVAFSPNIFVDELRGDGVHLVNGKYYRTSSDQYKENVDYWNHGFRYFSIDVTIKPWRVGPQNIHLNEQATDQVMQDLAKQVEALIPAKK